MISDPRYGLYIGTRELCFIARTNKQKKKKSTLYMRGELFRKKMYGVRY